MSIRLVDRRRTGATLAGTALLLGVAFSASPALAVNAPQTVVVSAVPANNTPDVLDGQVNSIVVVGRTVVIGGTFTRVQNPNHGTIYARADIAAFDLVSGAVITTFVPALNGAVEVVTAGTDGASVVAGGHFTTVDGSAWRGIAKLRLADGSRDSTYPARLSSGVVFTMVVRAGRLFVGGQFTQTAAGARSNLAVFNAATGALDQTFNIPVTRARAAGTVSNVHVLDVSPDATKLIISGNFVTVGGLSRNQMAMINLTTSKVSGWATARFATVCSPAFYTYIRDMDFSPDGSYFAVVDTGAAHQGSLCDSASRFETAGNTGGQQPTWVDYTGGDTLTAVAVTDAAVYVGGHQRWMNNPKGHNNAGPGAVPRSGLAALSIKTGLPLAWNPGRSRGAGVFDLLATDTGLWEGCDTELLGGKIRKRIGFFPLP
jgi:hypothetical protein